jgi:hypothetical protein
LALVVPGLFWLTGCFVAASACVVEGLAVLASLQRSAELSKGRRWKILGILLMLLIPGFIGNLVITSSSTGISAVAWHAGWSGVWGTLFPIFAVVTYHDLRVVKEGVDNRQIAAVFE